MTFDRKERKDAYSLLTGANVCPGSYLDKRRETLTGQVDTAG